MKRSSAFTLVELLVVIAIIVALISILLPSMGRAIAVGELAVCQSNLKQIGNATLQYLADHRGQYPPKVAGTQFSWVGKNGAQSGYNTLYPRLRPLNAYLGGPYEDDAEVPIARCPSDQGALNGGQTEYDRVGASYASNTNPNTGGLVTGASGYPGITMREVRSPARMVAMSEFAAFALAWWTQAQWASNGSDQFFWHGKPYFTPKQFADGHVAYGRSEIATLSAGGYTYHRDQ